MSGLFDVHCHIVPGVDDGADTMEEAVKMLKIEYAEGVRTIIATPHFRVKMFETPVEKIEQQFALLKKEAAEIGIDMYLGCEFHAKQDMVDLLKSGDVNTMAGSRYVLTEFKNGVEKSYMKERLYAVISKGYKPIVAHVERYENIRKDLDFIEEMVEMGAKMQINSGSIVGQDGFMVKRFCLKLMKEDLLHYVGTDGHGSKDRVPKIKDAYNYVVKKLGADYAEEIFIENPKKLLKHLQQNS